MQVFAILATMALVFQPGNSSDTHKKGPSRPQGSKTVSLKTEDKVKLKADYLKSTKTTKKLPRAGAVILVHDGEGNRKELYGLQQRIHNWGAAVMVVDLRGHGDSGKASSSKRSKKKKKKKGSFSRPDTTPEYLKGYCSDLASAVEYLRSQKKIDPNRISLIGVGQGGAIAMCYALNDLKIKGVGYLSPEKEIKEFDLEKEMKKMVTSRRVFLLGPESKKEEMEGLEKKYGGKLMAYAGIGEAYGLDIFRTDRTLEIELRLFLRDCGALKPGF